MITTTDTTSAAPATDDREAILDLLARFIDSRPGLEFANYGDMSAYRSEQRSITRDRDQARTLLAYVRWNRSIDGAALREAFRSAYSGRLSLGTDSKGRMCLDYCTGQYYPTEYRRAACAVLASAIWTYWWDSIGEPDGYQVVPWGKWDGAAFTHRRGLKYVHKEAAFAELEDCGGNEYGHVEPLYSNRPLGDYLRAKARAEFGASIARRWFN